MGCAIKKEIEEFFSDWDWNPPKRIDRIQNELILFMGIGVLYYLVQLGLMLCFFPSFENVHWFGMKAYHLLFSFHCILIFFIYKHFIFVFPNQKGAA
jgi:hypothetical protein